MRHNQALLRSTSFELPPPPCAVLLEIYLCNSVLTCCLQLPSAIAPAHMPPHACVLPQDQIQKPVMSKQERKQVLRHIIVEAQLMKSMMARQASPCWSFWFCRNFDIAPMPQNRHLKQHQHVQIFRFLLFCALYQGCSCSKMRA